VGEEVVSYRDGKAKSSWICKRVELNDLSSPQLVEYVEEKLREHGATEKVIPSAEEMQPRAKKLYDDKLDKWVDEIIAVLIGTGELKSRLRKDFEPLFKLQGARVWAETEFEKRDREKSWRGAVQGILQTAYEAKHKKRVREAVRQHIRELDSHSEAGADA